jgi:hypothetical protein
MARVDELDVACILAEVVSEQLDVGRRCHREEGLGALYALGKKRPDGLLELIVRAIGEGGMVKHRRGRLTAVDEIVDAHTQRS